MTNDEVLHYEKACDSECSDGEIRIRCEILPPNIINSSINKFNYKFYLRPDEDVDT